MHCRKLSLSVFYWSPACLTCFLWFLLSFLFKLRGQFHESTTSSMLVLVETKQGLLEIFKSDWLYYRTWLHTLLLKGKNIVSDFRVKKTWKYESFI